MKNRKLFNRRNKGTGTGSSSFLGGLFLGSAVGQGNSSNGVFTECKTDDNSLYCKMIRYKSIFSNILYFIVIFAIFAYVMYYIVIPYLVGNKKGISKRR